MFTEGKESSDAPFVNQHTFPRLVREEEGSHNFIRLQVFLAKMMTTQQPLCSKTITLK